MQSSAKWLPVYRAAIKSDTRETIIGRTGLLRFLIAIRFAGLASQRLGWAWRHTFPYCLLVLPCLGGCAMFRPSPAKLFAKAVVDKPYEVVIVPGMPYDGKEWSSLMKARLRWSNYLLREGIANHVIYSGGAVYTPYVEAKAMALYAEALGVPKEKIYLETQAEHSTENIYYSYRLAEKLGFTKIAYATDPVQSAMLMGFSRRRFTLPITHIPFLVDTLAQMDVVSFNPVIQADSAYVDHFVSVVKRKSIWQRLKGTFGRGIPYQKQY
jgi:uncharacterized SAM-binding protein YcdF (DUF218 family)